MPRNRAEGWKHAKLSGHINEELIRDSLNKDINEFHSVARRLKKDMQKGIASIGGLNEKQVISVFEKKTKSKTDLIIKWNNNGLSKISIKKSEGGQVYLIKTSRFIEGYEKQFKEEIPFNVKEGFYLFFGEGRDIPKLLSDPKLNVVNTIRKYELRKKRMVWQTLLLYNKDYANSLLKWIKDNIKNISIYCFSMGLAKDKDQWAEFIWYKNLLGENDMDFLFSIEELSDRAQENANKGIYPGSRGGGTTIQLPFGFLQWHQGQMQFHHQLKKIKVLLKDSI